MKQHIFCLIVWLLLGAGTVAAQWKPVPGSITTPWTEKVNPHNPLPEYPRPQLVRGGSGESWINLNGLWQYSIVPKTTGENIPAVFGGNILVPFAVESSLSGVGKTVGKDSVLWYNRIIDVPQKMRKGRLLLHFGAVDWSTRVYVNGKMMGAHEGGYDAFSIDITAALNKGTKQVITVYVWDPTDDGPQPIGKQTKKPHGIWYTSVTGIWQTVWLESVPQTYIASTRQIPDIDKGQLDIAVQGMNLQPGDKVQVSAWDGNKQVAMQSSTDGNVMALVIPQAKLWSPQDPFLYDLKIAITRKGKIVDEVKSYFGMRKISVAKDKDGIQRMMLNNHVLFQYGPLDQGWWPDGLYTAPTDEALRFDIAQTKALGFNMIRKHVKVEPARWYYDCDRLGMLVWQDMPSGDMGGNAWDQFPGFVSGRLLDKTRTAASEAIYRKEWGAIMSQLYNNPCIVVWTPFNEAWGQFKTREIADLTKALDPGRLVNAASGGNYVKSFPGDIFDLHHYPDPYMPDPNVYGDKYALVLGEFGGLGLPVENHTWVNKGNWGYQSFKSKDELYQQYKTFIDKIPALINMGLSAAVYTQTTDVEVETNGLFTYDRKVLKYPVDKMYQLHQQLYVSGEL